MAKLIRGRGSGVAKFIRGGHILRKNPAEARYSISEYFPVYKTRYFYRTFKNATQPSLQDESQGRVEEMAKMVLFLYLSLFDVIYRRPQNLYDRLL